MTKSLSRPEVIITHESDLDGLIAGVLLQRLARKLFNCDVRLEACNYNYWKQRELRERSGWITDLTFESRLDRPNWVIIDHHVSDGSAKNALWIHDVNKSASAFNPEKLLWLNQQHMQRSTPEHLAEYLRPHLTVLGVANADMNMVAAVADAQRERAKTLQEMAQNSLFFFRNVDAYEEKAAKKNLGRDAVPALRAVRAALSALAEWRAIDIHGVIEQTATQLAVGMGKIAQPIRVAVSGTAVSPPIDATLEILGRARTLQRIDAAVRYSESA